ncbi:RND transporter [Ventosimonas gracilis]|uniref:RND transporter n=1 Tax=Ventosimonas gracilis TaxID=1680762 RepID=A0A139SJD7_9GAMM|nr:MMPL family transporter [Ventosimonas gracilis]KXU34641.1 RND transporter [Ventosimonas gracilis]
MNDPQQEQGTALERLIFNNRPIVIGLCLVVTVFLAWQAVRVLPETSFEKMIPQHHPIIANMFKYRSDLEGLGGNNISIVVEAKEGDIFNAEYLETLRQMHDEVFFLPGVDRSALTSLWSPAIRWVKVTEDGLSGGEIIPQTYDGSAASITELRNNLLSSQEGLRLVAKNFKSSMINAPLLESYPDPDNPGKLLKLDYQRLSHELEEKIRDKYQAQNPNVVIHITGFAKKVGDLIDGLIQVVGFFAICLLITFALLYLFTWCIRSTIAVVTTTLVAVIWQIGLVRLVGFGIDPYSMLVPFLVFAIGISHGVQKINGIALQSGSADTSLLAARRTFRQLFLPGMIAILADAVGFITLMLIDIGVIHELAIGASLGVAVIVFTNLILLPVAISYIGISRKAIQRSKNDAIRPHPFWRLLSNFAGPKVAPISIFIALALAVSGFWYQKTHLQIGDLDSGAPELRPDSRYNLDVDFITKNYSVTNDLMVVMVVTPEDGCTAYSMMEPLDRLMWKLTNTEGVQSAESLVTASKLVVMALNEGSLKWQALSRNQSVLDNSVSNIGQKLFNNTCSMAPLLIFLDDHKAATLARVTKLIRDFAAENDRPGLQFMLGAGDAAIEAATNEVIARSEILILLLVYLCVGAMCLITFRSIAATACIVLPLILTSILGNALMAFLGIGVKVATMPVIALGVGIGVDYGIYVYSRLSTFLREGLPLQEAYYQTLKSTGRAVLFTGLCLALGVETWVYSAIKFQADMGLMLTFMFLLNMWGALWLLPALARYLIDPNKIVKQSAGRFSLAH